MVVEVKRSALGVGGLLALALTRAFFNMARVGLDWGLVESLDTKEVLLRETQVGKGRRAQERLGWRWMDDMSSFFCEYVELCSIVGGVEAWRLVDWVTASRSG